MGVYWVRVQASNGPNTFTVNEVITSGNFTRIFDLDSASVFTSACGAGPAVTASQGSNGAITVGFNAAVSGTYFVRVRVSTLSVRGQRAPTPSTVHYDFSTAGVSGSTSGVDLVPVPNSAHPAKRVQRFSWRWRLRR